MLVAALQPHCCRQVKDVLRPDSAKACEVLWCGAGELHLLLLLVLHPLCDPLKMLPLHLPGRVPPHLWHVGIPSRPAVVATFLLLFSRSAASTGAQLFLRGPTGLSVGADRVVTGLRWRARLLLRVSVSSTGAAPAPTGRLRGVFTSDAEVWGSSAAATAAASARQLPRRPAGRRPARRHHHTPSLQPLAILAPRHDGPKLAQGPRHLLAQLPGVVIPQAHQETVLFGTTLRGHLDSQ